MKVISAAQPFLENILNIIDNLRGVVNFRYIISIDKNIYTKSTGWVKKKWDLKKYVYCSEGHKN